MKNDCSYHMLIKIYATRKMMSTMILLQSMQDFAQKYAFSIKRKYDMPLT